MELILKGYDDKIPTLLEIVLNKVTNFTLSQERFDVLKDYMVRGLNNWADDQPYSHAFFYLDYLLHNKKISYAERLEKIDGNPEYILSILE
jgi:insulysin